MSIMSYNRHVCPCITPTRLNLSDKSGPNVKNLWYLVIMIINDINYRIIIKIHENDHKL